MRTLEGKTFSCITTTFKLLKFKTVTPQFLVCDDLSKPYLQSAQLMGDQMTRHSWWMDANLKWMSPHAWNPPLL
jgi:hypothetical protein